MTDLSGAAREFADLAKNLRYVGEEGLRKELYRAADEATQQLAREIQDPVNLEEHLPDPYAPVLQSSLRVSTHKRTGGSDAGVTAVISAPTARGNRGRQVIRLNRGIIGHPVFGRRSKVNARRWASWEYQTGGMRAGFVDDPVERAGPRVREAIVAAIKRIDLKARA